MEVTNANCGASVVPAQRAVSESSTCLETIHVLHKWRIESFSVHAELCQVGDALTSPAFGSSDGTYTFALRVFPMGKDEECRGYVSLFLQIKECPTPKARFRVKFFVETTEGPRDCALNRNIVTINKGGIVTASRFFSVEFLRSRAQRFLPNDILTVGCELYVFGEIHSEVKTPSFKVSDPVPCSTLQADLGRMFSESRHTDCRIVVGKTQYRVHRAMLAARSSVFNAMFEHASMKESSGSVEIKDVASEAVKALLEFIYTDECSSIAVDLSLAEDVMIAADKYALDRLKLKCEVLLCDDLNIDNVCSRLKVADMHSADLLRDRALEFVRENMRDVVSSPSWTELEKEVPRLAAQILKGAVVSSPSCKEPVNKKIKTSQ